MSLAFAEKVLAYLQGKGYGAATLKQEVKLALSLLGGTPNVVLDVGANKGLWTEQLLQRAPNAVVHAFEPQPACHENLVRLYAGRPNVHMHRSAVSNTSGQSSLHFDEAGSGLASLSKRQLDHFGIDFSKSIEVETVVLDDFVEANGIGSIDIAKFDVEGHEFAAFQGFSRTLQGATPPKVIQFEFGGCNIDTRTFFRDFYFLFRDRYQIYRQNPFGLRRCDQYQEADEYFRTTNYFLRLKS